MSRPERGYVVESRPEADAVEGLDRILRELGDEDIRPVRGRRRGGAAVVHRSRPSDENEGHIRKLRESQDIQYAAPLFSFNGRTVAIVPEIVLRVAPRTDANDLQTLCDDLNVKIAYGLEFSEREFLIEVTASDERDVFAAQEQLDRSALVKWAAPNVAFQPELRGPRLPNDPYFWGQWHLMNAGQSGGMPAADISAVEAWEITVGDPSVVVAVVDSGVDFSHPDLAALLVDGYDFCDDDPCADATREYADEAHGTACAGLIAAQGDNATGVTGVAWNCRIMPIRIFGGSHVYITEADVATALRWAANHGADVLSNSWGVELVATAVQSALADITEPGGMGREGKGCVVLWAAGNSGDAIPSRDPAAYPEVIAVGATDHSDRLWSYSSYGPELDLVAPSGGPMDAPGQSDLWTTDLTGETGWDAYNYHLDLSVDYTDRMGGTSGACPIAAGAAALVLSVAPDLTGDQVRQILQTSAVDLGAAGYDPYYGYGRIDAREALEAALAQQLDLDASGAVDLYDFARLGRLWRTDESSVDAERLALMARYWLGSFTPAAP